jgi:hypothetical protein
MVKTLARKSGVSRVIREDREVLASIRKKSVTEAVRPQTGMVMEHQRVDLTPPLKASGRSPTKAAPKFL